MQSCLPSEGQSGGEEEEEGARTLWISDPVLSRVPVLRTPAMPRTLARVAAAGQAQVTPPSAAAPRHRRRRPGVRANSQRPAPATPKPRACSTARTRVACSTRPRRATPRRARRWAWTFSTVRAPPPAKRGGEGGAPQPPTAIAAGGARDVGLGGVDRPAGADVDVDVDVTPPPPRLCVVRRSLHQDWIRAHHRRAPAAGRGPAGVHQGRARLPAGPMHVSERHKP
jgi:hypothetical protein